MLSAGLVEGPVQLSLIVIQSKVELFICWVQGLLGGLSNVLETLRGEGVPPPACRAVVHAALRFVDAELLNALMLRRDCCSISAIKVLQVRDLPSLLRGSELAIKPCWLGMCRAW